MPADWNDTSSGPWSEQAFLAQPLEHGFRPLERTRDGLAGLREPDPFSQAVRLDRDGIGDTRSSAPNEKLQSHQPCRHEESEGA